MHLRPHADVAERVLLPGDPGRALRLAQQLLDAPLMLNHNRGLWGYTGAAADGAPLTIQSTGMGGPSAAIVIEELIALGARRLVRVGTCGALDGGPRDRRPRDRRRRAGRGRREPRARRRGHRPARARPCTPRCRAAADGAREGLVVSTDLFYDPDPERAGRWARAGALVVEMEAATLFARRRAARRGGRVRARGQRPRRDAASGSPTTRSSAPRSSSAGSARRALA